MENEQIRTNPISFDRMSLVEAKNGILYKLVFVKEVSGRYQPAIAVFIQSATTKKQVQAEWETFSSTLEIFRPLFGDDFNNKNNRELFHLYKLHQAGMKTGEIVKIMNLRTLALVCFAYKNGEVLDKDEREGISLLRWTFADLQIGDEQEMEVYLNTAYEDLENERLPWRLNTGPVDTERVRILLDGLSRRIKKDTIRVPEDWGQHLEPSLDAAIYGRGAFDVAIEYMKKYDRPHWQNHNRWIKQWVEKAGLEVRKFNQLLNPPV